MWQSHIQKSPITTVYPKSGTIGTTSYEQTLGEIRAAVPGLQAIAERAYALAAATTEEGRRRGIERVGIRAADLIIAIAGLGR